MPDPRAGREEPSVPAPPARPIHRRAVGIRQATAYIAADNHAARLVAEKARFLSAAAFTAADGTDMTQYLVNLTTWS